MNVYYVYQLHNPLKDNQPFYVGKGKGNRCEFHLSETLDTTSNPHKVRTINLIKEQGLDIPISKIAENLSEDEAYLLESQLIAKYGRASVGDGILTNICIDARPPNYSLVSPELQKTWSENIRKGNLRAWRDGKRVMTEQIWANLSKHRWQAGELHTNYGKTLPPSWCSGLSAETDIRVAKAAEKRRGQKRSSNTIELMSKVQTEVQNRPEVRRAKSEALRGKPSGMLGKTQTKEARAAIGKANSIALKGRKRDPEAVRKTQETKRMKRLGLLK